MAMSPVNEYETVLRYLYSKTFALHDPGQFHRVLYFYLIDSLAHIDYTCSLSSYHYLSPKNIIGAEYMRRRIDLEKQGDNAKFPSFIAWLQQNNITRFEGLPSLWQLIYDPTDPADYRSFMIVLDPESNEPTPPEVLRAFIDEFFEPEFLKSLYLGASLAQLFETYSEGH